MFVYVNEYYKNLNKPKNKLNINYIKNIIGYLKNKNVYNIKLPDKLIYFVIYLIKHNCKFILINNIIYKKILKKISHRLSLYVFNNIKYRWINILKIAISNDVCNSIIDYFLNIYDLYLEKENNDKFYIFQAKYILGINIKNKRQLRKYFTLNLYHTVYYINIIFKKVDKKYLSLNYIYKF